MRAVWRQTCRRSNNFSSLAPFTCYTQRYQQQLASTALKRGNSTASLVVKKEGSETVLKVDKAAKSVAVDDDVTVGFLIFSHLKPVYQPT